jgi:hypothetical protein
MRNAFLLMLIATLPLFSAAAQPFASKKPEKAPLAGRALPLNTSRASGNSCAGYGPGFAKVEGTDTCVKIGGSIGIGAGHSSGSR